MPRRLRGIVVAPIAVAALAPVLAAGHAIADDWIPIGDSGAIAVQTHDVFSSATPLLGNPTTLGGPGYEPRAHHPGPLEFWTLAIPTRLAGSEAWGIVVGVALVGIASLVAVGWASGRMTGASGAVWALGLTGVACWSLGRQVLADPWNPFIALLPLAAALFLTWAAAAGDAWALPPLAFAATFAAQSQLLYGPLALVLFVIAAAAVARRAALRQLATTAAVLVIVWLFPIWEQVTNQPGNVVALWRALRADEQVSVSWVYAFRAVARGIGLVPLFGRPARDVDVFGAPLPTVTLLSAVAVVAGLAVLTMMAVRRRDRLAWSAGAVALAALAVTTVTTAQIPAAFPDVAFYQMVVLWPVGCFTWFALGLQAVRTFSLPVAARRIGVGAAVVVLVVSAPAVVFADSPDREDERNMRAVRALSRQVEPKLEDLDAVRIEATGEVYADILYGMVYRLRRQGVDARVAADDHYLGRAHPAPSGAPVLVVIGGGLGGVSAQLGSSAQRIGSYRTWSASDLGRLAELDEQLRAVLDASGIDDIRGRDPYALYRNQTLLQLRLAGDLTFSDEDRALLRRYVGLRFEIEELVFTAYLVPGD